MSPNHSSKPAKPSKPYPEYPLTAHPAGYWCKKIKGKTIYFGAWADPDAVLAKYLEQKETLHAGRKPRPNPEALTVKEAVNNFLNFKKEMVTNGELSPRTWDCYKEATDAVIAAFGKARLVAERACKESCVRGRDQVLPNLIPLRRCTHGCAPQDSGREAGARDGHPGHDARRPPRSEVNPDEDGAGAFAQHEEASPAPKNRRHGPSPKTVRADLGDLPLRTPRDRHGTFEPPLLAKYLDGIVVPVRGANARVSQHTRSVALGVPV